LLVVVLAAAHLPMIAEVLGVAALEVIAHLIQLTEILVVAHQQNHQFQLVVFLFIPLLLVLAALALVPQPVDRETMGVILLYQEPE
jgi:hypothetical protein